MLESELGTATLTVPKVNPDAELFQDLNAQEMLCLEALTRIDGVGPQTLQALLKKTGNPQALWEAEDAFLRAHLPDKKREAFERTREGGLNFQWLDSMQRIGASLVGCTHARYPGLLGEIHQAPAFLYVQGNVAALSAKTLAVVGTRQASEYGRQVTRHLIEGLKSAEVTIVSGLAAGIDTEAHWAAVRNGLPTVAVFGCGLDVIFPAVNRRLSEEIVAQGGALVSEYPLGMSPTRYTFPQRNRIVAGLSHGLLVVEGDLKSGALITARLALEEGRTVFAVPGNIFNPGSQGTTALLKQGAVPVSAAEDLLKELKWWLHESGVEQWSRLSENDQAQSKPLSFSPEVPDGLSAEETQVWQAIGYDPVSVDDLQQTTGLPSAKISGSLTLLELEGLIVLLPGAKVCRKSIC